MGKRAIISGVEREGRWVLNARRTDRSNIPAHNGADLKSMVVKMLRAAGGNAPLANAVNALEVSAEPGYDSSKRATWSVTELQDDNFLVQVVSTKGGEEVDTEAYDGAVYAGMQAAVVGLLQARGAIVFAAQVEALEV